MSVLNRPIAARRRSTHAGSLLNRDAAERGFTLLEVLIAVALMAILGVLCWRGLDSVIAARDRITAQANEIRALSVAFTQLDEDLRRSWPVRTLGLRQPSLMFIAQEGGDAGSSESALVVLREGSGPRGLRLQQVVYRLRSGVLERGFSRWQATGFGGEIALDRLSWQPLINGVEGIAFRAWVPGTGWLAGESLRQLAGLGAAASPQVGSGTGPALRPVAAAPAGVELTLNRRGQRIVRLFAIED